MVILHVYIRALRVCVWWVWVWVWIRGVPSLLQTRYKQAVSINVGLPPSSEVHLQGHLEEHEGRVYTVLVQPQTLTQVHYPPLGYSNNKYHVTLSNVYV